MEKQERNFTMPLCFGQPGHSYKIVHISQNDKLRRHLGHLGLVENETISLQQSIRQNLIIEVKGSRIALDRQLASRIQVQEA